MELLPGRHSLLHRQFRPTEPTYFSFYMRHFPKTTDHDCSGFDFDKCSDKKFPLSSIPNVQSLLLIPTRSGTTTHGAEFSVQGTKICKDRSQAFTIESVYNSQKARINFLVSL